MVTNDCNGFFQSQKEAADDDVSESSTANKKFASMDNVNSTTNQPSEANSSEAK